eukprot:403358960
MDNSNSQIIMQSPLSQYQNAGFPLTTQSKEMLYSQETDKSIGTIIAGSGSILPGQEFNGGLGAGGNTTTSGLGLNYINSDDEEYLENEFKEEADSFLQDILASTRQQAIEELISDLRKDQQNQQALLVRTLELMRDNQIQI